MKVCFKCKKDKNLSDFPNQKGKADGKHSYCNICFSEYKKQWKNNNQEYKEKQKIYRKEARPQRRRWENNKLKTDPIFKLRARLRDRFRKAFKHGYKSGSAIKNLGCSIEDFKIYIESKFELGMNWNNYGQWHIDHIKPLSKFDLDDLEQLKEAIHYTNLQPLWAIDNLKKSDKA